MVRDEREERGRDVFSERESEGRGSGDGQEMVRTSRERHPTPVTALCEYFFVGTTKLIKSNQRFWTFFFTLLFPLCVVASLLGEPRPRRQLVRAAASRREREQGVDDVERRKKRRHGVMRLSLPRLHPSPPFSQPSFPTRPPIGQPQRQPTPSLTVCQ